MWGETTKKSGRIFLLGRLTLTDAQGRDCTPHGAKTKALLALLALSPRGSRSRTWLKDKLWSDREDSQASGSLRQAIMELKKALAPDLSELLVADRENVSLRLERLQIDVKEMFISGSGVNLSYCYDRRPMELLEGLDVGDPEFEDWLTLERQHWSKKVDESRQLGGPIDISPTRTSGNGPGGGPPLMLRLGIGLLPCINNVDSISHISLADLLLEAVVRNLQELQPIDLYDFRDSGASFGITAAQGPDLLLRVRVYLAGNDMNVTMLAYRTSSQKLVWTHSIHAEQSEFLRVDAMALSAFVNQNVDRIAHAFFTASPEGPDPQTAPVKTGYAALNLIFRDDEQSLASAEQILLEAYKLDQQSMFLALLAYTSTFRVGEHLGEFTDRERLATITRAREALSVNPFNSVTLACVGHVYGYVLRDLEQSGELLRQALEINPHQAFVWDHYALFCLYTGNYDAALSAAKHGVQLGSFSPLRYSFETTLSMAATLTGDYRTAIFYARRALARQPRFAAAMRYLTVALSLDGKIDEARAVINKLQAIGPDFSLSQVKQNSMAISEDAGRARLVRGFEMAGLH